MSSLDIEQAGDILRAYASAVIDEYENGGTVYELDYIVRLEKAIKPVPMLVYSEEDFRAKVDAEAKLARIAALIDGEDDWAKVGVAQLREVLDGGAA
jgi:hypothetical protein